MKKFGVDPISFIVWVWLLLVLGPVSAFGYFFAIVLHECGHFFYAKHLGYKLSKFSISPYGVSLSYYNQNLDFKDELKIALAGPLANLLSVIFVLGLWWVCPSIYFLTSSFVEISLIIALFNLLPAYPLDGGRIFICLSSYFFSQKVSRRITVIFNVCLSVFFMVLFVVCMFINFNPSYLLFAFFLICGVLDLNFVSRYEKVNIFCKTSKNFSKPTIFVVYPNVQLKDLVSKIQTSKTIVFCLVLPNGRTITLSEKMVINMSINFDLNCEIGEIIKNN